MVKLNEMLAILDWEIYNPDNIRDQKNPLICLANRL